MSSLASILKRCVSNRFFTHKTRNRRRAGAFVNHSAAVSAVVEQVESRRLLTGSFAGDWDDQMQEVVSMGQLSSAVFSRSASITEWTDVDLFRFEARAGQQISTAVLSHSALTPRLRLFGPLSIGQNSVYQELGFAFDGQTLKHNVQEDATFFIGISELDNERYSIYSGNGDNYTNRSTIGEYKMYVSDTQPTVDLKGSYFDVSQTQAGPSAIVDVNFRVSNSGGRASGRFNVDLYISGNDYISQYDTYLGSVSVAGISGNSRSPLKSLRVTIPASFEDSDGSVSIGMMVDPQDTEDESDESNNKNRGDRLDFETLSWKVQPGVTELTAPDDGDSSRPEFSWKTAEHSTHYELWVAPAGGSTPVIHERQITETSFRANADLAEGSYRAWVRPFNTYTAGEWSDAWDFRIHGSQPPRPPKLIGPEGSSEDTTPTFRWQETDPAATFDLWVDQIGGRSQIIREKQVAGLSFTPQEALPAGDYRFWVRAENSAGAAGNWSSAMSFRIGDSPDRPTLVGPQGTTADTTPTFEWKSDSTAVSHDLWVDQLAGKSQIIREPSVTGEAFTPTESLPHGSYRFWVRAENAAGQASPWSAALAFTVSNESVPGRVSWPADWVDVSASNVQIRWDFEDAADYYDVWVDNLSTGKHHFLRYRHVESNSLDIHRDELPAGTYRFWVRAINTAGAGVWSSYRDADVS